eukprot:111363-Hanusia_phi.AAC.1
MAHGRHVIQSRNPWECGLDNMITHEARQEPAQPSRPSRQQQQAAGGRAGATREGASEPRRGKKNLRDPALQNRYDRRAGPPAAHSETRRSRCQGRGARPNPIDSVLEPGQ